MKTWKSLLVLPLAVALVASTAWAQSSSDRPGGAKGPNLQTEEKPGTGGGPGATSTGSDPAKSDATKNGADSSKSDATKADKSTTAKPDKNAAKAEKRAGADKAAGGGDQEQVKTAQQALKDKGHDPGAIDGIMGPRTQAALKDFQKKEGLKETGRLDSETTAKLGEGGAGSPSTPAASPKTGPGASGSSDTSSAPGGSSMPGSSGSSPSSPSGSSTPGSSGTTGQGGAATPEKK